MTEPLAVWNGEFLPSRSLCRFTTAALFKVRPSPSKFAPFRANSMPRDGQRLQQSLDCVHVNLPYSMAEIKEWMVQLSTQNHSHLESATTAALLVRDLICISFAAAPGIVPADRQVLACHAHLSPSLPELVTPVRRR